MANASHPPRSMLAIDVGEVHTRAMLFDLVEGRYRFLAIGTAQTTARAPHNQIGEGIRRAIARLEVIADRDLIDKDGRLISPGGLDGSGIDSIVATMSAGPPLKIIAAGLLEDVSLASAERLASSTYSQVVDTIGMNDRKKPEERLDSVLKHRPDVIAIAGGTEDGASNSVTRLVDSVGLACSLMPREHRPEILYMGNQELISDVGNRLGSLTKLYTSPNVRPELEIEQLLPAQNAMIDIFRSIRARDIPGVGDLDDWSGNNLMPTSTAFGRIIRFLSKVYDPTKGVLGLDVGASATTVAASFDGELTLGVFPEYGLGDGIAGLINENSIEEIQRWIPLELGEDYIRDYIYNKSLYPATLPVTDEDLAIEQTLARTVIRNALKSISDDFPKKAGRSEPGFAPWFEPIVATGSVLTQAPSTRHSLLTILDSVQPTGITTIVLDQNHISASLGAAAPINPFLTVQVLESSAFLSLATVISPVSNARQGTPILRMRVSYPSGDETSFDVKKGTLETLPIPMGESVRIRLQPLHRSDVGMGGPGRGGTVRVVSGTLGVIVDARGRPLLLPRDATHRHDLYKKWLWTLGG